jgi:hypothetical protein
MKCILTIITVLIYAAIMIQLVDSFANGESSVALLSLAGIIGLTYGGFKLIQLIFRKL